jgi:hypothetical protein
MLVGRLNSTQTAFSFDVSYQGLQGAPISGTHFHNQASGVNGPIVRGIFPSEQNGLVTPNGIFAGVWSTSDPTLDPRRPEIVIYEPTPNGGRRLIGADFLVFSADWHASNTGTPQIMGQLMHLIESPNRYGLPAFYTLHVWAWKPSPTGAFVNWHSDVSCENFNAE